MRKPLAVLISDVHYNLQTLKLADAAMRMAFDKANALNVPLIVAGDLHDTKANIRGECVKAMRDTFKKAKRKPYVLIGNHDKINEKSGAQEHSLHFLGRLAHLVAEPWLYNELGSINGNSIHLIPYQHDIDAFVKYLAKVDAGSCIITHQGYIGANTGEYFQDKAAIQTILVGRFRVISGHYHTRQTLGLLSGNKLDYIGNPYTLTWAEADDPEKGFQILYRDGSLGFVPTNLRKHVVVDIMVGDLDHPDLWEYDYKPGDLLWVKVHGDKERLNVTKQQVAEAMEIQGDFKLDLIPREIVTIGSKKQLQGAELLDSLIDSLTNTSDERKARLKELWRNIGT